jgi:predicted aldo/keto reductase-like oxidoreductase
MQFRKFGEMSPAVSVLGFGCMRLPTHDGNPLSGQIDEAEAIKMIRHAIDRGVNYLDTAYPYHAGSSEILVGKALRNGYRDKVLLATKSPIWFVQQTGDFDRYLNEQLQKLQTDCIDCYLLHGLDRRRWEDTVLKLGLLGRAEAAVRSGSIRYIGFSFHDSFESFEQIIRGYEGWDFCQIQYNYLDTENQAGVQGLQLAAAAGLGVVVMEPLLGGRLANPPAPVRSVFDEYRIKHSPSDWALQWLWNQPEVSVVLSGMGAMDQVVSNLRSAERAGVESLTMEDLGLIERVRRKYQEKTPIPCTKCGYCIPCPNGVNIPKVFELFNDGFIHEKPGLPRMFYTKFLPEGQRASACIACDECVEKCPQKIAIPGWMPKVHGVLGEGREYSLL